MKLKFIDSMLEIGQERWLQLDIPPSPFLRFEFLQGLEAYGCVGEHVGWIPHHLLVEDEVSSELLGFMPLYIKYNSYGELVFDWAWADAYQRAGRDYYPKLVSAIPYTPVTGPRILTNPSVCREQLQKEVIGAVVEEAKKFNYSSVHCLFPDQTESQQFSQFKFVTRLGCQFHWCNEGYQDFDDFLSRLNSRKRKNIKKERAKVSAGKFQFRILQGDEIEDELWPNIYHFYEKTFEEKGGYATFTLPFFKHVSETMGDQLLVILAYENSLPVAAAIFYKDHDHLYGRHWGSLTQFDCLHFEVCYYLGIEYAIKHGIKHFEPGAQGEHKISRGFLPELTWSTHWIKDHDFSLAIEQFVERERIYMKEYVYQLNKQSPFKVVEIPQEKNFNNDFLSNWSLLKKCKPLK